MKSDSILPFGKDKGYERLEAWQYIWKKKVIKHNNISIARIHHNIILIDKLFKTTAVNFYHQWISWYLFILPYGEALIIE